MKRIFAAIKPVISNEMVQLYHGLKSTFRSEKINWVDLNNIHLTLKFFGETPENKIQEIHQALGDISLNYSSFLLQFKDLGVFGSSYKPRVIWLGIEENPQLINLATSIIQQMEHIGFIADRQNFVPHISIGRIKHPEDTHRFFDLFQQIKSFTSDAQAIDKFYLFESKLYPSGPEYSMLHTYKLT